MLPGNESVYFRNISEKFMSSHSLCPVLDYKIAKIVNFTNMREVDDSWYEKIYIGNSTDDQL